MIFFSRCAKYSIFVAFVVYLTSCAQATRSFPTTPPKKDPSTESSVSAPPIVDGISSAREKKAFIWNATSNENPDKQFFLLGSIHVAKPDFYPLDPVIEEAFNSSEALVVEVDLSTIPEKKALNIVMAKALLPQGETLEHNLTPETWAKLLKVLNELKISPAVVERLKPWFAAVTIVALRIEKEGYSPEYGIDQYFMKKGNKQIIELETAESQLALFDDLTPKLEELLVIDAIEGSLQSGGNLPEVMRKWQQGDALGLAKLMFKGSAENPEFRPIIDRLFISRNKAMANRLEEILTSRTKLFVVVGAGHLVGEQGLVEIFKNRGYTLHQLERKDDRGTSSDQLADSPSSDIGNAK